MHHQLIHGSTTCRSSSHGASHGQRWWSYKLRTTNPTKPAARAINSLSQNGHGCIFQTMILRVSRLFDPLDLKLIALYNQTIKNILLNFWVHIYKCNHWEADGTKALVSNKDLRESNFVASVDMPWSMKSHLNTILIRFSSFLITQKLFNSCFKKFKSLCDNLRWTSLDRNFARSDNNHLNGDDVWIMYESYEQHVDWVCSQALRVGPWHPLTCWILELESV